MSTPVAERSELYGSFQAGLALKFLAGPACFLLIYSIGVEGLSAAGTVVLATLGWAVVWWVLQPVPWAITSLLPLVLFPLTQTMSIAETAQLYGQNIFFWIMGTSLFAYAIQKHGLAKRFALFFLAIPGVASSTYRLLFFYMLATAMVSWFVSDASAIALMMPLALSLQTHVRTLTAPASSGAQATARAAAAGNPAQPLAAGAPAQERTRNLATFFALGTLYAAVAGGIATMAGMPHNAVAVAQLETITGRTIGWFTWMMVGVPTFITLLVGFYLLLLYFFKPEVERIPGGEELVREERKKLGKMKLGEKSVLGVFFVLAALFTLPPLLPNILGSQHPVCLWLDKVMSIWIVPPIILLLLFSLPADLRKRESVLDWKEAAARTPWHILFLVTSAVGMTDALANFGFMKLVTEAVKDTQISPTLLPFFTGVVTSLSTNFISGVAATSIYTGMLIPVAQQIGFNPASITILVPSTAMGLIFPWAGATVGTAFGFGEISLKDLIRVGILAEIIMIMVAAVYCLVFAPFL